jgi:hypothetical protein
MRGGATGAAKSAVQTAQIKTQTETKRGRITMFSFKLLGHERLNIAATLLIRHLA